MAAASSMPPTSSSTDRTTRTSKPTPPPRRLRRHNSAVSATLARPTSPTTPTPSPRSSSKHRRKPGEDFSSPFFVSGESKRQTGKRGIMKHKFSICILLTTVLAATAQVASHAPTVLAPPPAAAPVQVTDKPVARVNGAVLTDRDLLREMYAIFPFARQHNGFPK